MKDTNHTSRLQADQKPRRKGRGKYIALGVLVVAAAAFFLLRPLFTRQQEQPQIATARIARGDIQANVTGTGAVVAADLRTVTAKGSATVEEVLVQAGDEVKQGDVLARLTNTTIDHQIATAQYDLRQLDASIAAQRTSTGSKTLKAPLAGRVKDIRAAAGDVADVVTRAQGHLAVLSTDGCLSGELSLAADAGLHSGDALLFDAGDGQAPGYVLTRMQGGRLLRVLVKDDTLPIDTATAVYDAQGNALGSVQLGVNKPVYISSNGGVIESVDVEDNEEVSKNAVLFTLEDAPESAAYEKLRLDRQAAADKLADSREQRDALLVSAPCDGVVATVSISADTDITAGAPIATIIEDNRLSLSVSVDELDIPSIEPGQPVTVTADALEDVTIAGTVDTIAPTGISESGITKYLVTIDLAKTAGLRVGMNAEALIEVAKRQNVLLVPIEAIQIIDNQRYVYVLDESVFEQAAPSATPGFAAGNLNSMTRRYNRAVDQAMQGGVLTKITIGVSGESYAEVLDGLAEGDMVLLIERGSDSPFGMFGMGGNMGGRGQSARQAPAAQQAPGGGAQPPQN